MEENAPLHQNSKNKFLLPIILVTFLILEITLWGLGRVYLEKKIKQAENFRPVPVKSFSFILAAAPSQNLELVWDNGQQRQTFPLSDITAPFYRRYTQQEGRRLDHEKLVSVLTSLIPRINRPALDAKLEFSEKENRLKEFALGQTGLTLNLKKSVAQIVASLSDEQLAILLAVDEVKPAISMDSIESLGINALLGRGESNFDGSSSNRITNIKVGAGKFHGLLIKSGEEFSFNDNLGEIEASAGYQPELVIKNNKLVSEYGGGLCQVSTTLFRAAIYAGLPILERRPHSFPVRYYNPQGFDATIYPGQVDLRFKNDTPGFILIQTKIIGKKLVFEIYGSADGRKVTIDGPYQYDQRANGAMKAYFSRTISYGDEIKTSEKFSSAYRPPPASPLEKNPLE